MPILFAIER